jgi:DNA-nicking Smr family endonuclease
MRRPPSISFLELSALRRKRILSEEERALWESVTKHAKPLRGKKHRAARPDAGSSDTKAQLAAKSAVTPPPSTLRASPPKIAKPAMPPLASLGRRERLQLSRGRKEIEARLDLHGMTQARAHRALLSFLQRAHLDGLTFVLIITGKGKVGDGEAERGVLRRQVPQWLSQPEFRNLVVGFEAAHIGHGGEGALYVRVRRSKT